MVLKLNSNDFGYDFVMTTNNNNNNENDNDNKNNNNNNNNEEETQPFMMDPLQQQQQQPLQQQNIPMKSTTNQTTTTTTTEGIMEHNNIGYKLYEDVNDEVVDDDNGKNDNDNNNNNNNNQTTTTTTSKLPITSSSQSDNYYNYQSSSSSSRHLYYNNCDDDDDDENFIISNHQQNNKKIKLNEFQTAGMICCCCTIVFMTIGIILILINSFNDDDEEENETEESSSSTAVVLWIGSIFLIVALGACFCSCCTLCIGNNASSTTFNSNNNNDQNKEVKLKLRKLNNRYEKNIMISMGEQSLQRVCTYPTMIHHMKELKDATKREMKLQKENDTKQMKELEERIKNDINHGKLTTREIQRKMFRPITFYIVFQGDVIVSTLELLRKQVSLVVHLARPGHDKCVISLTSPGGAVTQYGLAASQLVRIRKAGIHLTICVDSIAASGGYMMASVADKICAAPFAIVGSIGVITQIPNFQRFLNEHKVDAYVVTAGDYKRTIDVIGDVTEEGKAKLTEQLDDIHVAFKEHVALARPQLRDNIHEVGTGEHWLAVQAKQKGLVDEIMTSDEYLESIANQYDIIEILEKKESKRGDLSRLFMMGDDNNNYNFFGRLARTVQALMDKIQTTVDGGGITQTPPPMAIV